MSVEATILALEEQLLTHEVRRDSLRLQQLLADDFLETGASGRQWNKTQSIEALLQEDFLTRAISDFAARQLADGIVLATYRCECFSVEGYQAGSLRSSLWRRKGDSWELVYHQGTRIPA